MNISSRPVRIALASVAALVVTGAASAAGALTERDGVASETSPRVVQDSGTAPAQRATQPFDRAAAEAEKAAPAEPAAAPARQDARMDQGGGGEGYEGPGTDRVPHEQPVSEGGEDEGPGTDRSPAPVYRTVTPSSWRIVVPSATVYAVPGDAETRTGSIGDRRADIAGTGRAATVGTADWYEVKVPGASTGWVVGTELEQL